MLKKLYSLVLPVRINIHTLILRPMFKRIGKKSRVDKPNTITPWFISLGDHVNIGYHSRIQGIHVYGGRPFNPSIVIHDHVSVEQNIHLTCASSVTIGANTAIAANVSITDIIHPYEDISLAPERQPIQTLDVVIGPDCKIYNNAVILPGTVLGRHTVVGANSVVLGKTYPDYCVLAGSPAKILKRYDTATGSWIPGEGK